MESEKRIWCMYCKEYIPRSETIVHHRMHQMVAIDDMKQNTKEKIGKIFKRKA
jgi:ribosomal protein S26